MGFNFCIPVVIFVSFFCRIGIVRVMSGIPKRVTSLCFRALSEIFSLSFSGDLSANWGV